MGECVRRCPLLRRFVRSTIIHQITTGASMITKEEEKTAFGTLITQLLNAHFEKGKQ